MIRTALRLYRDSFSGLPRAVWLLAVGLLVNRAGTMVLPFLSLYLVEQRGLTTGQAGTILLSFGLGSVAGTYVGGKLSDRFSAVHVQEASLLLSGIGFLVVSQLRTFELLIVGLFVLSVVSEAFRPASMTATVRHCPSHLHVRALALSRLAANLGWAVGPAAGGLLASVDYVWLFVGDAVTCWLAALLLLAALRPSGRGGRAGPAPTTAEQGSTRRGIDGRFLALLGITFVLALAFFQLLSTVPLYLGRDHGLDERQIGLLFALNGGLIALFEMVLVRHLERRNAAVVLAVGGLLVCAGFAILPLGTGFVVAAAAYLVLTIGEMLSLPFGNGLVARLATEHGGAGDRTGSYMGWYNVTFSVAMVVAPLGLPALDALGPRGLWFGIGALGPVVGLVALALSRRIS